MKSNLEPIKKNNKNNKKIEKIELNKVQEIALLSQAMMILAIIISFIMSRFVVELNLLFDIYLIILCIIMAYTNYSIYKRIPLSIIYIIFGIMILISTLFGIYI